MDTNKKSAEELAVEQELKKFKDKAEVVVEKMLMDLYHTPEYRDCWRRQWNKIFPNDGV